MGLNRGGFLTQPAKPLSAAAIKEMREEVVSKHAERVAELNKQIITLETKRDSLQDEMNETYSSYKHNLKQREQKLDKREEDLATKELKVSQDTQAFNEKVEAKEIEFKEQRDEIDRKTKNNLGLINTQTDQRAEMSSVSKKVDAFGVRLAEKENELNEKQKVLESREKNLNDREIAIQIDEQANNNKETQLDNRENDLDQKEADITEKVNSFQKSKEDYELNKKKLQETLKKSEDSLRKLDEAKVRYDAATKSAKDFEKSLQDKEQELNDFEAVLNKRLQKVERREQLLKEKGEN